MIARLAVTGLISTLGLGLTGCVGDDGSDGATGPAGPEGPAGPAGPTGPGDEDPPPVPGAVYTLSNDATFNAVFAFDRAADGSLTPRDVYLTGGTGSGSGLGNANALVLSQDKQLLFAVNPGDSSISTLELNPDRSLTLLSKIASGGIRPVSVTTFDDLVYVVNAGNATTAGNISGFRIDDFGLTPIAGSTQPLSAANPAPAQISFTPSGDLLVVSEKATNKIDTYVVTAGVAGSINAQTSAGATPFGFAFSDAGQLIVSEAAGGAAGASTASSYTMSSAGEITPVSSAVPSAQSAACWAAVAGNHVYMSNTGSNNLSSYTIGANGSLALVGSGANAPTGAAPADSAVAEDFLYVLDAGSDAMSWFTIAADGSLTAQPDFTGMPANATGLVAF